MLLFILLKLLYRIHQVGTYIFHRNALGVELINEDNQSIAQILIDNGLAEVHTLQNGDIITNSNMCNQILDAQSMQRFEMIVDYVQFLFFQKLIMYLI